MSEDIPREPGIEQQIGETILEPMQEIQHNVEVHHEELKSVGKEIFQGLQDLLDTAEDFQGISPHGWELGHDAPSYVSAEFKQNAKLHELDGWQNPKTELFTKKLRIQETNVVAPHEQIKGQGVRITLLEVPEEPETNGSFEGNTLIKDTRRLDIVVYLDGNIDFNSYLEGDSRDWVGTIDGPGTFGHGNKGVTSQPLNFEEKDAQHLLQIIKEIQSDAKTPIDEQNSPSQGEVNNNNEAEKEDKAHGWYAERLESWTAILSDSKPSEAFKQRFGMEVINARMLANLERSMVSVMADETATETMVQTAQLQKTFLEDISSGRASQWQ